MQPTIGRKRVERYVDARTSGSRSDRAMERGAGKSQKDPGTYAIAYDALNRNRQFQVRKRSTKVALRGNPRGVSSHHVF